MPTRGSTFPKKPQNLHEERKLERRKEGIDAGKWLMRGVGKGGRTPPNPKGTRTTTTNQGQKKKIQAGEWGGDHEKVDASIFEQEKLFLHLYYVKPLRGELRRR